MSVPSLFADRNGEAVSLGLDFIGKIAAFLEKQGGTAAAVDRLVDLLGDPDAGDDPDLDATASELRGLRAFAARLGGGESLRKILERLRAPVSALETPLAWAFEPGADVAVPAGQLHIAVSAAAGASARIAWTEPATDGAPPALVIGCEGEAAVSAGITLPFDYGSIGVRGGASGRVASTLSASHAPDTPLYRALAIDLPRLVGAAAATPLLAEADRPDAAFQLELEGDVRLGASLSAGKSYSASRRIGEATVAIEGAADVAYSVDWSRWGRHRIAVSPDAGAGPTWLRVRIEDAQRETLARSLSIGANLRITGLDEAVKPVLARFARLDDELSQALDAFARPSALLAEELEARLAESGGPIATLVDLLADERDPAPVVEGLVGVAVAVVDERAADWTALLRGEVHALSARVLDRLDPLLVEDHRAAIENGVGHLLEEAASGLQERLRGTLDALSDAARDQLVSVLEETGESIDAFGDAVDDAAARLIAPARRLLERFRSVREKLSDAVEATTREELAVRFLREVKHQRSETALVELRLDTAADGAGRLYRAMLRGDFADAMREARAGSEAVEIVGGLFQHAFEVERTQGFSFDLFGIGVETRSILTSSLTVEYDASGTISVFDGRAALEERRSAFGESQSVKLSSGLQLVRSTDAEALAPLALRLNYQDEDLEKSELRRFLKSVESAGLLDEGATDAVVARYEELGLPDASGDRALSVDLALPMTGADLHDIEQHPSEARIRAAIEAQVGLLVGLGQTRKSARLLDGLDRRTGNLIDYLVDKRDERVGPRLRKRINRAAGSSGLGKRFTPDGGKLWGLVVRLRDNAEALDRYVAGVQALREAGPPEVGDDGRLDGDALARIEKRHRKLVRGLDDFVEVDNVVEARLFGDRVTVWNLALVATLDALTRSDLRPVPIVSWRDAHGRVQKVVFG